MATLDTLVARGVLIPIHVPLGNEPERRWIYGFPEFEEWLKSVVPHLESGRLKGSEPPMEQLDYALYRWTSGKRIQYDRHFKDLMPLKDEVWELKTLDLRIFGWMHRPMNFVAVFGDYADLYKPPSKERFGRYETAKQKVISARQMLDIDEPKFAKGTFDDLVHV